MSKLLIYTVASGHYRDYIKLWEYCIAHSYPEYDLMASSIDQEHPPIPKYFAACYRLLFDASKLFGHEYVYVTDVDMMILRENPTILDFHTSQMYDDKLSYSNSPRTKEYLGESRLTGLHFASKDWYAQTRFERDAHLRLLKAGKIGDRAVDDEICLMNICKNAKLRIPKPRPLVRRHHGIHLGTLRHYPNRSKQTINQQLLMRISPEKAMQWLRFYDDKEFVKIIAETGKKNREIKLELDTLYSFCKRWEKQL